MNRILLIGHALRIPNFDVIGVENPGPEHLVHAICCETDYLTKMVDYRNHCLVDPLHTSREFEEKRQRRMPPQYDQDSGRYLDDVRAAYCNAIGIEDVISALRHLTPGGDWANIRWPWEST